MSFECSPHTISHDELTVLKKLIAHVVESMPPDPTGHDWPHVERVFKNALYIAKKEGGDPFPVMLIALTHDLYDHKFFDGTTTTAREKLSELLREKGVPENLISSTVENVFSLSFSKNVSEPVLSHEGKIVQDADRLEAIGAIGIARAFAYGGFKNRLMNHSENQKVEIQNQKSGTTFDHFFEKLLKLYDLLNTETARDMARERFDFMKEFVKRFELEWNSKCP